MGRRAGPHKLGPLTSLPLAATLVLAGLLINNCPGYFLSNITSSWFTFLTKSTFFCKRFAIFFFYTWHGLLFLKTHGLYFWKYRIGNNASGSCWNLASEKNHFSLFFFFYTVEKTFQIKSLSSNSFIRSKVSIERWLATFI